MYTNLLVISHKMSSVHGHESSKGAVSHSFKAPWVVKLLQCTLVSYFPAKFSIYVFHMNLTINCDPFPQQL
jgi:hypothetical protein